MEEMEYNYIKCQARKLTGIDLNCYKAPQMQRRLKAYLIRSGYPNWPKFFKSIQDNQPELNKFKDYLTINVSSFYRDLEKYKHLQNSVLPELLQNTGTLRVWSAGCSRGQEAYSLAILLAEANGKNGTTFPHRLLATDIDHSALQWAKAGGPYSADDVSNLPNSIKMRYFKLEHNQYWVQDWLRQQVMFRSQNLLSDPIMGKFDLIVCRNVVIYFQPEAKERLYQHFFDALKPGGVLFVGGTEIVPKASLLGFEATHVSFYRKVKSQSGVRAAISA
jgi:chemotaxis protein methyltransferase CheR